jgi:gliding motility-associated-like protein
MRKILLLAVILFSYHAKAQLPTVPPFASLPYNNDFEMDSTSWQSYGVASDWTWGAPTKQYITSAGSGFKCWITGTTSSSFYNGNQQSYLVSPSFDFSNITYPYISFQAFWETEKLNDGVLVQYTLDQGITWLNVGTVSDPINCLNQNWYNTSNLFNLGNLAAPPNGWSGSALPPNGSCLGGNGSNGWLTAKHTIPAIAGKLQVIFRFVFGTSPGCNNFDGFAFDNIYLGEAPPNQASWYSNCASSSNTPLTYNFSDLSSSACADVFVWNFGDPASGVNNTFNGKYPSHTFSAPGTYTITEIVSNSDNLNRPDTLRKVINTINSNVVVTPPLCTNDINGKSLATTINATAPLSYGLKTIDTIYNNSTGAFSNLKAGTYTLLVQDLDGCKMNRIFTVTDPTLVTVSELKIVKPDCALDNDGKIEAFGDGGSGSYMYRLNNTGNFQTDSNFTGLSSANAYTVTVRDGFNCTANSTVALPTQKGPNFASAQVIDVSCHDGYDGQAVVIANSAVTTISAYTINPIAKQLSKGNFSLLTTQTYTVTAIDANNCTVTSTFTIQNPDAVKFENPRSLYRVCKETLDTAAFTAIGGIGAYKYSLQPISVYSDDGIFKNIQIGKYTVVVRDANNCGVTTILKIDEGDCCNDVFLPNAFTPDFDGINDNFKMIVFGTIIINKFKIINRMGEIVFDNNVPQGWDGYYKGLPCPADNYYFYLQYTCSNGNTYVKQGDVFLLR